MWKSYQLPGSTKNSSYYKVPRAGIELTTSRLHRFITAKVFHALTHSAMEAILPHSLLTSILPSLDCIRPAVPLVRRSVSPRRSRAVWVVWGERHCQPEACWPPPVVWQQIVSPLLVAHSSTVTHSHTQSLSAWSLLAASSCVTADRLSSSSRSQFYSHTQSHTVTHSHTQSLSAWSLLAATSCVTAERLSSSSRSQFYSHTQSHTVTVSLKPAGRLQLCDSRSSLLF